MIQIPGCYLKKIQGPFLEKTVKKLVTRARSGKFTLDVLASIEKEGLEFWAESEDSYVP